MPVSRVGLAKLLTRGEDDHVDDPVDVASVKAWLKAARKAAGHSQRSLAEATGVGRRTILNLESNNEDVSLGSGVTLYTVLRELGLVREPELRAGPGDHPPGGDRLATLEASVDQLSADVRAGFAALAPPRNDEEQEQTGEE